MPDTQSLYAEFLTTIREVSTFDSIDSLLRWDQETQMPPRGAELRAGQTSLIARLSHERFTSPRLGEMLCAIEQSELTRDPLSDPAVNVRETRRLYDRLRKIPSSLVEEISKTTVLAHAAWADAKQKSDYRAFQPWLDKMLHLKRQEASCVGYEDHPYDALLDAYEPGEKTKVIRALFSELRGPLVEIVGRIAQSPRKAPLDILQKHYPAEKQAQLGRDAAERLGFDFSAGRIDVSVHPFCSSMGPGDTRMTTRYDEHYFGDSFFSVLHETGHALYEQGLPKSDHFGTPRGESASLGIHESQSRMWENFVGRARPFWEFFFPKVRALFPAPLEGITEDQWLFAVNDIRPSLIRTEADEATYNLHVLLRFELEQAMLTNDLATADIPAAWNDSMKNLLGLTPPDDAQGCLQDVHWSHGAFGYFPTYTLGNLYAAQLFDHARRQIPDLDSHFSRGDFSPLLTWLRSHIHAHGKRHRPRDLVRLVTGQPPSPTPLLKHLNQKARDFYNA